MIQPDAETIFFADAIDTRKKFLRGQRAIKRGARRQAVVARAAIIGGKFFAEIRQQFCPPAARALGVVNHLLQLFAGNFLFLRIGFLVNETSLFHHVAGAEEQNAFARQTVAARAAGFLIIAFDVFRQIVVNDEAHVRLVDAHAEGDGGADHAHIVAQKKFLVFAAFLGREAGVIGPRLHAVLGEIGGDALGGLARLAIHDAAFLGPCAEKMQQLVVGLVFRNDAVGQVGTIETGDITFRLAQFQMRDDVLAHAAGGGGGKRHEWHFREKFPQIGNLAVFRTKIVAPFADAMRLVHGDEADVPALQIFEKTGQHQPLRRGVEQAIFAVVQTAQALP